MAFQSIRRILPSAIQHAGIEREVKAQRVLDVAKQVLVRMWGDEKAAFLQPISFMEGTLKFRASSPVALQEFRAWETRLRNEMNHQLGEQLIRKFQAM